MNQCLLSIIIVNWNTRDLLRDCLSSLFDDPQADYEVIVVDNGSSDGSACMIRHEFPAVQLIENTQNDGYARANNLGIRSSCGRYLLLLNSDTLVSAGALPRLIDFMEQHPTAGACGPRLVRADGRPQSYAFGGDPTLGYLLRRGASQLLLHRPLHDWATSATLAVDWVSGACLLARRAAIQQAGPLDERFFMYFEDNEWCLRIRKAGWSVYYYPAVEIVHLGGQSLARNPQAEQVYYQSLTYFYTKHYSLLARWLLKALLAGYRIASRR
jgi:GT2 family glycosyltransferase